MRRNLSIVALALAPTAVAQEDSLLLLAGDGIQIEKLFRYSFDGTVLGTNEGGTGFDWLGAAALPNRHWVCTHTKPTPGLSVFERYTGVEIASIDLPPGVSGYPLDVSVFSDGSVGFVDMFTGFVRLKLDGQVLISWIPGVAAPPAAVVVDYLDEVWILGGGGALLHYDRNGNEVSRFNVNATDLAIGPDGTLWTYAGNWNTDEVRHFDRSGALMGAFDVLGEYGKDTLAVAGDGTVWVTRNKAKEIHSYATNGAFLSRFAIDPSLSPRRLEVLHAPAPIGTSYCSPANANSTGLHATLAAAGSERANFDDVLLVATDLPPHRFGLFLTSRLRDFVPFPGGSQGNLCLGGVVGLFAGQVSGSGPTGSLSLQVDTKGLPPFQHSVQPGETWNFQAWFRDANPAPTSNFTDAVSVLFK